MREGSSPNRASRRRGQIAESKVSRSRDDVEPSILPAGGSTAAHSELAAMTATIAV